MRYKVDVIAITLTPVGHKRHIQFLTSATNFREGGHLTSPPPWPGLPESLASAVEQLRFKINTAIEFRRQSVSSTTVLPEAVEPHITSPFVFLGTKPLKGLVGWLIRLICVQTAVSLALSHLTRTVNSNWLWRQVSMFQGQVTGTAAPTSDRLVHQRVSFPGDDSMMWGLGFDETLRLWRAQASSFQLCNTVPSARWKYATAHYVSRRI